MGQWLRIHLSMLGSRVHFLVREDPTCHRAIKPVHHCYWARTLYSLCSATREATAMRNPCTKRREQPPLAETNKKPECSKEDPKQSKKKKVHNSVAFSMFIVLCNHHLYTVPEPFHHPQKETLYPLSSHSPLPPPPSPWQPLICLYGYAYSGYFI